MPVHCKPIDVAFFVRRISKATVKLLYHKQHMTIRLNSEQNMLSLKDEEHQALLMTPFNFAFCILIIGVMCL